MEMVMMTDVQKKAKLQILIEMNTGREGHYYNCLSDMGDLKGNYYDYLKTRPMDATKELKRLPDADFDLCAALLTMVLREDHFCNGSFEQRYQNGEVTPILQRMIDLL